MGLAMEEQFHPTYRHFDRVKRHRERAAREGFKRCEVRILDQDERLIRSLAAVLNGGGEAAQKARNLLSSFIAPARKDIVSFFQESPLSEVGAELDLERNKDTGRAPDF